MFEDQLKIIHEMRNDLKANLGLPVAQMQSYGITSSNSGCNSNASGASIRSRNAGKTKIYEPNNSSNSRIIK
jgi:hypothetical protein